MHNQLQAPDLVKEVAVYGNAGEFVNSLDDMMRSEPSEAKKNASIPFNKILPNSKDSNLEVSSPTLGGLN